MRVLSPADPGYVEWCRSGMPQRIRLLKLAAEKRRRIEQGVICPKCHRRRVRAGDTLCGLRVKMCVWLGVSRGLDLAFLNAD